MKIYLIGLICILNLAISGAVEVRQLVDERTGQDEQISTDELFGLETGSLDDSNKRQAVRHLDTTNEARRLSGPTIAGDIEQDEPRVGPLENAIKSSRWWNPRRSTSQLGHNDDKNEELDRESKSGPSFAWLPIASNKCSRACGRGFKLNRFSCFDTKFQVRVEDQLCHRAELKKPTEVGSEPCNEIDCKPDWSEVEYKRCVEPITNKTGGCREETFKQVVCSMLDLRGHTIYLDQSQCVETLPEGPQQETVDHQVAFLDQPEIIEAASSGPLENLTFGEAFFEPGPWSICIGQNCNQVGYRTRTVTCKIHLSQTWRLANLASSACDHLQKPQNREDCYVDDCNEDELIDDTDMSRFVWRSTGWTECSSPCNGGHRKNLLQCWDKQTEQSVEPNHCGEQLKPETIVERCNVEPCEWLVDDWSSCSEDCGLRGVRRRSVRCIKQSGRELVSNDLCSESKPEPKSVESCNQIECPPEWVVHPWSNCSSDCGVGIRSRAVHCIRGDVQVESEVCQEHKHSPHIEELCTSHCNDQPYIDVDLLQDYRSLVFPTQSTRPIQVSLKVGGRAELLEGMNLKIRCKVLNRAQSTTRVQWFKDGLPLFNPTDKIGEEDNSIASILDYRQPFNERRSRKPRMRLLKGNSLRIRHLRRFDSGIYTCTYGPLEESISVRVVV